MKANIFMPSRAGALFWRTGPLFWRAPHRCPSKFRTQMLRTQTKGNNNGNSEQKRITTRFLVCRMCAKLKKKTVCFFVENWALISFLFLFSLSSFGTHNLLHYKSQPLCSLCDTSSVAASITRSGCTIVGSGEVTKSLTHMLQRFDSVCLITLFSTKY